MGHGDPSAALRVGLSSALSQQMEAGHIPLKQDVTLSFLFVLINGLLLQLLRVLSNMHGGYLQEGVVTITLSIVKELISKRMVCVIRVFETRLPQRCICMLRMRFLSYSQVVFDPSSCIVFYLA